MEKQGQWQLEGKIIKIYRNGSSGANINTRAFTESLPKNALQPKIDYLKHSLKSTHT